MSGSRKPQILKGFRDYLPEQMLLRQEVMQRIRRVFESHGFEPLDTPVLEYMEILTGKAGENEKLMYHFQDAGEREIGLRYDLTVPLARFVAMHQNDIALPFKRYHIAPVWRAEKPQRGRFREFWQCDADIVGIESTLADAEAVSTFVDAYRAIGLTNAVVAINHRKLLEALALMAGVPGDRAAGVFRIIDKLDKIGADKVRTELLDFGASETAADAVLRIITTRGTNDDLLDLAESELGGIEQGRIAINELRSLVKHLQALGVPADGYRIDLALARGIDYYTGPVWEAQVEEPKIGSVGGGGRYDGLVGTFLGRDIPATGISLGIERIVEVIQEFDLLPTSRSTAQVAMVNIEETISQAGEIARELRAAGINIDQSLSSKSIGQQLKYADRRGIPYALIPGTEELANNQISLKNLSTGDQITIDRDLAIGKIQQLLNDQKGDSE
ncbi:MAG: histidine--tRNA ligase [Thermomicrobiales bacterium]|nr:histidine--tRNA ligase [Thermomicrobiales bacterium]